MDQDPLARLEPAARDDVIENGEERLRQSACLDHTDATRHRQAKRRVRKGIFGIAAGSDERAYCVAFAQIRDAFAERYDVPGDLQPRHVAFAGRRRIFAGALQAIGTIDAGGGHLDQHFARAGLRHRGRYDTDDVRSAGAVEDHLPHHLG